MTVSIYGRGSGIIATVLEGLKQTHRQSLKSIVLGRAIVYAIYWLSMHEIRAFRVLPRAQFDVSGTMSVMDVNQ